MANYFIRRLLLVIPTLFGIMLINFALVQAAPGGPVDQLLAQLQGIETAGRTAGGASNEVAHTTPKHMSVTSGSDYRGAQGLPPELLQKIKALYGFDKPAYQRFFLMMKNYLAFDFGSSYFRNQTVIGLILDKMPVSISLGLWSTLLIYLISIPLGIKKALKQGSPFDIWSSSVIIVGYAIPAFLFAIVLIVLFSGGSYWHIFPLRGLTSDNFDQLSLFGKITDYFWHLALPLIANTLGGFATLTLLTKNAFLDEIHKHYVTTARAKGISEKRILYGHVFRNAMLIIIAGFPGALITLFFTSSLLTEVIFSLDGLGLLSYESITQRDYPVVFGSLYLFTLLGLTIKIISDFTYTLVDPRIDFQGQKN